MSGGQFRTLVRKYGYTALGTYCAISTTTFWTIYFAIENKFDVKSTLQEWGLLPAETKESEIVLAENTKWYKKLISEGKGGSIALAFLCTKALVPIKLPLAMSLTPIIHKCLISLGLMQTVSKKR